MSESAATPTPLDDLRSVAVELTGKWDASMKAGKLLAHLEGRITDYDPRVTRIVAALAPTALAEAKAQARRDAFEEAAKVADEKAVSWTAMDYDFRAKGARSVAQALRYLATAPAETEKPETGWRPITEAPKDGTALLLWSGIVTRVGWWTADDEVWRVGGDSILRAPTHFRPLPTPPQPTATNTLEDGRSALAAHDGGQE